MKLEEYRRKRRLNYQELAVLLGLRRSTTYNICKEKVSCISLPNAHRIVKETNGAVDYDELLWGDC
jgi:DNA-binding XRE family transcriptional regulator